MIRFPPLADNALDAEQRRMAGMAQHSGPYHAFIRSPLLWQALQSVRQYLAQHSSLGMKTREALMLVIARHWDSTTGFQAHAALARKAGLDDADIDAIGRGDLPDWEDAIITRAVLFAKALLDSHGMDDADFADARTILGEPAMVDIIGMIGFFTTICLTLNLCNSGTIAPFSSAQGGYSPADEITAPGSHGGSAM